MSSSTSAGISLGLSVVVEVGRDSACEGSSGMIACVEPVSGLRLMIGLISAVEPLFDRSTVPDVEVGENGA